MRVGLFTNNYLPFRGGVTTAVETLRLGLEALGHRAWVFAPAAQQQPHPDPPFVDPCAELSRLLAAAARLPAPGPGRPRARSRRRPRAPSVPARGDRPEAGPGAAAPARLHLPHALREVRPLRPAASAPSAEPCGASVLPLRRLGGPGRGAVRSRGGHAAAPRRPRAGRGDP